jgi:hypothetical protein
MSDVVTYVGLALGFGFVFVVAARLGDPSRPLLAGLFPARGVREWPTGIQEDDAPRFAVVHLDGLRPGTPVTIDASGASSDDSFADPPSELFDLGDRRLGTTRP